MNNKEFIAELSRRTGVSTKDTTRLMSSFVDEFTSHLEDEDSVSIQSFGTFEVKKKLERVIVLPNTKERKLVPPKIVVNFKVSQSLKDKMQD